VALTIHGHRLKRKSRALSAAFSFGPGDHSKLTPL